MSTRQPTVCFLTSAGAFIAWQIYSVLHLVAEGGALRAALSKYSARPPLTAWSNLALSYSSVSWLLPLGSVALVLVSLTRARSGASRIAVLTIVAGLAVVAHICLTEGLYAPVVWYMNRIL